ncbi:unnamed protein product [Ambrosiozyma monospora]|uniref:Unnamed protein product n=1 Tax=Ambrosiozyma monospora TaxID=43982 RepID=A0A9W6YRZ8_AMBMO|nr:unnamed protein product [Ambrosiozyma monospora]
MNLQNAIANLSPLDLEEILLNLLSSKPDLTQEIENECQTRAKLKTKQLIPTLINQSTSLGDYKGYHLDKDAFKNTLRDIKLLTEMDMLSEALEKIIRVINQVSMISWESQSLGSYGAADGDDHYLPVISTSSFSSDESLSLFDNTTTLATTIDIPDFLLELDDEICRISRIIKCSYSVIEVALKMKNCLLKVNAAIDASETRFNLYNFPFRSSKKELSYLCRFF